MYGVCEYMVCVVVSACIPLYEAGAYLPEHMWTLEDSSSDS